MRYFLGTVEVYRGGRYCIQPLLFKAHRLPGESLWHAVKKWYGFPDEINVKEKVAFFEGWETSVRPDRWKEISPRTYEEIKMIIQEVE